MFGGGGGTIRGQQGLTEFVVTVTQEAEPRDRRGPSGVFMEVF